MATLLSSSQLFNIVVAARTSSVFSVMGSAFIISTFVCFPYFRKPINRLVFFASLGNLLAIVATLISTSGFANDPTGVSRLCEFQGVLIQWFMMADSLWVLCMATNVLLVFFYGYGPQQLRHLEKWYLLTAYGIPAIPAISFVIVDHTKQRIIGPATLWCWIRKDVDWMRIAFFYAPVWIVLSTTMAIYIVVGVRIFQTRALLRAFSRRSTLYSNSRVSDVPAETALHPFAAGNKIVVTTQIKYDIHEQDVAPKDISREGDEASMSSFSSTRNLAGPRKPDEHGISMPSTAPVTRSIRDQRESSKTRQQHGKAERSYYKAAAFAANTTTEPTPTQARPSIAENPVRAKTAEGNAAAMAYLRVAFLMFVAMFVVWVPSTMNRLYQFVHKKHPSFVLNIVSATVLPLQGAWNAAIYFFTTRMERKRAYVQVKSKLTGNKRQYQPRLDMYQKDTMTSTRETRDSDVEIALDDILAQGDQTLESESDHFKNSAEPNRSRGVDAPSFV